MDWITDSQIWIGLVTLTLLEIVLGVDNIVFISILTGKLPKAEQKKAWNLGLILALIPRVLLLMMIPLVQRLNTPLFKVFDFELTGQNLVLVVGGLFLIAKSTREIHNKLEGAEGEISHRVAASFSAVMAQIVVLNIVFSLDSVITAMGMTRNVGVMIAAVLLSTLFMLVFAQAVGAFVEKHPTVKMLALAFLILIGTNLLVEGLHIHIPKGYTYFAMAFSVAVEALNLRLRRKEGTPPVHLRKAVVPEGEYPLHE